MLKRALLFIACGLFLFTSTASAQSASTWKADARKRAKSYLDWVAKGGGNSFYQVLARLETGQGAIKRKPIEDYLDFVDRRPDTADFKVAGLVRLLHLHGSNKKIPQAVRDRLKKTLLGFKYWVDEPGKDEMITWTENHFILFASAGYLLGKRFPNETFTNSGKTGRELAKKMRPHVLRWLRERLKFGFSEWYSPVYSKFNFAAMANLIDFAPEKKVRELSAMVMDLLIFDLARLQLNGHWGVTAGRAYGRHKFRGQRAAVGDVIQILWGTRGGWDRRGGMAATHVATMRKYEIPHALLAIGHHVPTESIDRSRVSIDFDDGKRFGIGFNSLDDGLFWWGTGAMFAPKTIKLSRKMLNRWNLWHMSYFKSLRFIRKVPGFLLPFMSRVVRKFSEGSILSTANIYTYRTPDAMLSTAQAYRPGTVGFQQHPWQATLGLEANVFTTYPAEYKGKLKKTAGQNGPTDWTGNMTLPHVVQVKNVAVILYKKPGLLQRAVMKGKKTHAYFPKAAFDEVHEKGHWVFARKGDGYLGLYSARDTHWQTKGKFADRELIAPGKRNIWICQVGRRATDGSFRNFMRKLRKARVRTRGLRGFWFIRRRLGVDYDIPGVGRLRVRWKRSPRLKGKKIRIGDYRRFDNGYAKHAFGAPHLKIEHKGLRLGHDYKKEIRGGDGLSRTYPKASSRSSGGGGGGRGGRRHIFRRYRVR